MISMSETNEGTGVPTHSVPDVVFPKRSSLAELLVSWGLIIACFVALAHPFGGVGIIVVLLLELPEVGYRRRDSFMLFIPLYGVFGFMPKIAWRIGHKM